MLIISNCDEEGIRVHILHPTDFRVSEVIYVIESLLLNWKLWVSSMGYKFLIEWFFLKLMLTFFCIFLVLM